MKRGIVVVGSVNTDMVLRCQRLPLPGETLLGRDFEVHLGGKGANQAVAATRLGAEVHLIGCVGDDVFGTQARATLAEEGVGVEHLRTVPGRTGVAMILVEDSGQNCIALHAGANAALTPAQVEAAQPLIAQAALLVCQLESPLDAVQRAMALANEAGVPVLLNPAPAQVLPPELLQHVDVLVPNESEAAILVGHAPGEPFDVVRAAQWLRDLGARTVLVTLGEKGVHCSTPQGAADVEAPRVKAVDTTGAGDTFIGAFAAARCRGASLHDAVAFGQRAAALCVTRPGAMASMPHAAEMQDGPSASSNC
jgi:ribokinase